MKAHYLPQLAGLDLPAIPDDWWTTWATTDIPTTPKIRRLQWELNCLPKYNFDSVTAITGPERIGKSKLAMHLATSNDGTFDNTSITFQPPAFVEMGRTMTPGRARLWDEGPFSKDAMTREIKDADEHLFRCGQLYLHNYVIKPNLRWMGAIIREHRAGLWHLVTERGKAKVHMFRRADYPGAKPSWTPLFGYDYPDFLASWLPEYEAMKRQDLYPTAPASPMPGERALPPPRWERLVPGFRKALAIHREG